MEPQKCVFNPFKFLTKPEELQDYQCIICTEKSINIVRCKACRNCLCNQCAIDQKIKNNKCPYRCSLANFQVQPVELNLQFYCPFSQKCKKVLKCLKQFTEHDRTCQLITQNQRIQQAKKWQFRCLKNHPLQVYNDTFQFLIERKKCAYCGNNAVSRAICRKCDQFYCNYCRPFPIFQDKCPIGHKFQQTQKRTVNYRCDSCQLIPLMTDINCYEDFQCNMGFCGVCFRNWPNFNKQVQNCQNLNNYCEVVGQRREKEKKQYEQIKEQHKLELMQVEQKQMCSWCEKQKWCYKKCQKCVKYYCYKCKIFDVLQGNYCPIEHEFINLDIINEEVHCYSCRKGPTNMNILLFHDPICKVILCIDSLRLGRKFNYDVTLRKVRSFRKICCFDSRHPLFYNPLAYDRIDFCCLCQKKKLIKFNCHGCQQVKKFCSTCIQTQDPTKCYCGKELSNKRQKTQYMVRNCLDCDSQNLEQIYQCTPSCRYGICGNCIEKRMEKMDIK